MKLLKYTIVMTSAVFVENFCRTTGIKQENLFESNYILPRLRADLRGFYADAVDFHATGVIAIPAETLIFSSKTILAWLGAIDRKLNPLDYPIPFYNMIIQFSEPIPEKAFLSGTYGRAATIAEESYPNDKLAGLVIAFPREGQGEAINVVGFYESTSVNRVTASIKTGEVHWTPLLPDSLSDESRQDKQRLFNLAILCIAYITNPKVVVEKVEVDKRINRDRIKHKKRTLDPYYICNWGTTRVEYPEGARNTGKKVSYQFPVIGHVRVLADGKVTFVRPHFRGLEHGGESRKTRVTNIK